MNEMPSWLMHIWNVLVFLFPLALWFVFWLCAVNWKKMWPVLGQGAWAPMLLLMYLSAEVWSQIAPGPCNCLGFMTVPNFWWQLEVVCGLVFLAFCAGWLQDAMNWTPREIEIAPVVEGHDHH